MRTTGRKNPEHFCFERINGNELEIDGQTILFDAPIRDVKIAGNLAVVLLSIPFESDETDNLYAVDTSGQIRWRSQRLRERFPNEKLLAYEQITVLENRLFATDFYGRRYAIDLWNGNILGRDFVK